MFTFSIHIQISIWRLGNVEAHILSPIQQFSNDFNEMKKKNKISKQKGSGNIETNANKCGNVYAKCRQFCGVAVLLRLENKTKI